LTGKEAVTPARPAGRLSRLWIAALVIIAAVFVIRAIAPQTIGEQVRRHLVKQLQDHYGDLRISIGRGHYEPKIGLIFEDLRIAGQVGGEHDSSRMHAKDMLRIERMIVVADTKPEKLLDKQNPLVTRRVVLDGVHVNALLSDDGDVSLRGLWPPPSLGPGAPRVDIKRARIHCYAEGNAKPIDVDLANVTLINRADGGPNADGGQADQEASKTLVLLGSSSFAKRIQLQVDYAGDRLDVRGAIHQAHLNIELLDQLPAFLRDKAEHVRGLDCVCDVEIAATKPASGPLNFKVKTTVHDGRFEHKSLPAPITKLRGLAVCRPSGITIEASQGMLGDAICRLHGTVDGLGWPQPVALNFSASGLLLDDRLARSLPPKARISWDRIQPHGRIDIVNARIVHNNGTWSTTEAAIDCKGIDVRVANFPYPVRQLVGRVAINHGIATCQRMEGRAGNRRLQCGFEFPIVPSAGGRKVFVVAADGPIPIDDTLIAALTPRMGCESSLEGFVRSLRPRGAVHLVKATFQTDADGNKTRDINLNLSGGHIRYAKFDYPLFNVVGNIRVQDDIVSLTNFHGTNANAGQILCDGTYRMPPCSSTPAPAHIVAQSQDSELKLLFRASNVPMDESLRSSLPASVQPAWDSISPSGVLDYLQVKVDQHGTGTPIELKLTAAENESEQVTNRALRIQPAAFPYRLDITDGAVTFDGSTVEIESLKARHDGTRISAHGRCQKDAQDQWLFSLNIHSGSRLDPNAELIAALPDEMRKAMHQLQLRGPVSIRGGSNFLIADDAHPKSSIDWDVVLQLEGNRIGDVGPVHSMRGELNIRGRSDQYGLRADGSVRIDSMHVNDLQITAIRGPYSVRDDRLHLGNAAGVASKLTSASDGQSIRGQLFDGTLELTGDMTLSTAGFDVAMSLRDGQVPTLLADLGHGRSELTGTFAGNVKLEGILGTTDLLKGTGSAEVTGANLYQLPLLVQLLNLLRITPTEDVAFTDADVTFGIVEEQINFDDLKLWGDLVSLHGRGTMNWRNELDLTFNTRVSPTNVFSKVMRPLRTQKYTLWDVDVRGPLSDPNVQLRPLEGVGQTLERIFPAISPKSAKQTLRDDTRY
jgi:hypothetical protein